MKAATFRIAEAKHYEPATLNSVTLPLMHRREFLTKVGLLAATTPGLRSRFAWVSPHAASSKDRASIPEPRILFKTSDAQYQRTYSNALSTLSGNVKELAEYPDPVLIEGSVYGGIWLECGPHEGLVYSLIRPHVARANHMAFLVRQREDGQIPCWIRTDTTGFGQILDGSADRGNGLGVIAAERRRGTARQSVPELRAFSAVSLVVLASALLACYVLARRATQVDPMKALREE